MDKATVTPRQSHSMRWVPATEAGRSTLVSVWHPANGAGIARQAPGRDASFTA